MFRKLQLALFLYVIFLSPNTFGQYWRTWTDPLYKIHTLLNDSQFVKAQEILIKKSKKLDTLHPVFWHSKTRIAEHNQQNDNAILHAQKAVTYIHKLQKNTVAFLEFQKVYYFDAYYLDLYYRKLLYEKYENERSPSSPIANQKLLGFYLQQLQLLAADLPITNVNRQITLPQIIERLNALNDTIQFQRTIESRNTDKAWDYLQSLGSSDITILSLPTHLQSFYTQIRDSFYLWHFELAQQIHTEKGYLDFIAKFPFAPQVETAQKYADELAFSQCRNTHTASAYHQYLDRYTYGKYRKQASMLLRYLTVVPVPFARADGKYVYVDSVNLRPWIDSAFDFAYPFCLKHHKTWSSNAATLISGCALVMKRDEYDRLQWYYIEKDGTPFNENRYDEIRQISANRAVVSKSNHYGLIDQHGRELLPPIFKKIFYDTLHKIGFVHNGERWALFNMHGKRITKFEYKEVEGYKNGDIDWYRFRDNRIWVTTESTPFFIDFQGNPFFWGNVSGLEPFELQHSIATLMNGNQVLIDTNGTAVSDTFLSLQRIPSSPYFLAQTLNKYHLKLTLLPSGRLQKSAWSSDKAIAWAWYWGKPVFQLEQHKESLFIDANDSLLLKGKFSDVYIFAQTIFIQQSRKNPKQKQSALVKKWFNPYLQSFSLVQADDIGILTEERIAVTQQKTAFLYHIDETPFPIFDANTSLAEVNSIRQITQLNRTNQFMVSTDTSQAIVNLEGRLLLPFYTAQIEEFGSQWYLLTDSIGARIVNDKNQVVLGPFEEINEEGFPGYFLIKQGETWIWIDSKKRLFSESV